MIDFHLLMKFYYIAEHLPQLYLYNLLFPLSKLYIFIKQYFHRNYTFWQHSWIFITVKMSIRVIKFRSNDFPYEGLIFIRVIYFPCNSFHKSKGFHNICKLSSITKFYHIDEFLSKWCIFTRVMYFHQSEEWSSDWWTFFGSINVHQIEKFSSDRWNFIRLMNCHQINEFSSEWWTFIRVIYFQ